MALQLRYAGEFLSRKSTTWRVEIHQEAEEPYDEVGELIFDADNALEIEWSESDKLAAVLGSTATLKIQSPTDRAYIDLYSVAVGQIRMDVYREGTLYWRGMLDTEFYEEPYEMLDHYTVTLTFSDFGILDRLIFNRIKSDTSDLNSLVLECLERAGLEYTTIQEIISTSLSEDGEVMTLADLSVRNSNFYDEEDEAMTMQEVLEGILQPLALRIMQKAGAIYVYDLNGLYFTATQRENVWSGDTQTLGVDSTYNNVKVTWSPFAQNLELPEECWSDEIDPSLYSTYLYGDYLDNDESKAHYFSYLYEYPYFDDEEAEVYSEAHGFSFWTSKHGEGVYIYETGYTGDPNPDGYSHDCSPRYFHVAPFYNGDEIDGVMLRFAYFAPVVGRTPEENFYYYGLGVEQINGALRQDSGAWGSVYKAWNVLFSSEYIEIPNLSNPDDYAINIQLELFIGSSVTPWNDEEPTIDYVMWKGSKKYEKTYNTGTDLLKGIAQYILVPVVVLFHADDGTIYQWQNITEDDLYTDSANEGLPDPDKVHSWSYPKSLGQWIEYDASTVNNVKAFIAYYSTTSPSENSSGCIGGWAKNVHFSGLNQGVLVQARNIDGQAIKYPDMGKSGRLEFAVYSDWLFSYFDPLRSAYVYIAISPTEFNDAIRWVLAKMPVIDIINSDATDTDLNTDDVEYSAVINEDAREDLDIDTICGTGSARPTARGSYFLTDGIVQMGETFTRNGLTGACEELLIATTYSQYAERHTTLQGEAYMDPDGLCVYKEQNQGDTLFLATEVVENVIQDVADTTIVELTEDDYEPLRDETDDNG